MVGTNMAIGVESKIHVYPEGESRPANGGYGLGNRFQLGHEPFAHQTGRHSITGQENMLSRWI